MKLALLVALVLLVSPGPAAASDESTGPRLAALIALPWDGETAMSRDVAAARVVLRQRGFAEDQIVVLDGAWHRDAVLTFLRTVRRRIDGWRRGDLFVLVSGHGMYRGRTATDARPGLLLSNRSPAPPASELFWDEIFVALDLPAGVRATLVPDT
jgi:hypothetical protein